MDLSTIIPNNNPNWIIKRGILYFHYVCDIPVFFQDKNNQNWLILDRRIVNPILIMINHLYKNNIEFFFNSKSNFINKEITEIELNEILRTYIESLENKKLFDFITKKTNFDYIQNLSDFINDYSCHDNFKIIYEKQKKLFLNKDYDYYQNKDYFTVPHEEIRDYVLSIDREIKIRLLL